ncbi:MAG: AN1-type zinc finger domain-containing protein [archaeon]
MSIEAVIFAVIGLIVAIIAYFTYFRELGIPKVRMPKKKSVAEITPPNKKKLSPVSGKCAKCRKKVTMPFRCKHCEGLYCDDHRLPENHDCKEL